MKTTFIYTLTDPLTNQIRYVGKTNNLSQRYKAHLNKTRDHQTHKRNWISSLRKLGLKPIIEILDIVPIDEWVFWETYWISQLRLWGFDLVNQTEGGDGCTFGNRTSFKKGQNNRPIIALTKKGEFVSEFINCEEGEKFCGKKCVGGALLGQLKSAGGYLWLYKDKYETMLSLDIEEFLTKCNSKKKTINSGQFKKGLTPFNKGKKSSEKTKEKIKNSRKCKQVLQYSLDNKLIKEHRSIEDAAKYVNGFGTCISAVCKGKKNCITYKNFKWRFKN